MEGWLYGIFTLLGVLVGGFFTYLGLRKQLKQQKEINAIEWRHKVRSDPLLQLRKELALMAVKYERLVAAAHPLQTKTEEAAKKELQEYLNDINVYIQTGSFDNIRYMLSDEEIINRIDEIMKDYRNSYFNMVNYEYSDAKKLTEAMEVSDRNKNRIREVQELINKHLEKL